MIELDDEFDAIIVGSGAAGGMAAYELTALGMRVAILEAGRDYDPATETAMFDTPERAPLRSYATPDKENGYYDATVNGGNQLADEPFTIAEGSEGFVWWRARMLGGRTNHWGRVALRFGPYDFKPYSRDGLGVDWPIEYSDLEPWYNKVEALIGVTGRPEGIENTPDPPSGIMLPPPLPRAHELMMWAAFESMGMRVAAMRAAVLTRPHNGRSPCLYSTPCTRGCSIRANFQSPSVLISPAHDTGRLLVCTNAVVYQVDTNRKGNATGVSYFDATTGQQRSIRGKCVILGAGTGATARILLNSKSNLFPNGIGNSNGLVGKFLMDTVEFTMSSRIPCMEDIPPQNDDGMFTPHIYVPWWLYQEQAEGKLDFPRGYHIEPRGGRRMPTVDVGSYVDTLSPAFGTGLHEEVRRKYGTYIFLSGEGEMIPNDDCYCELDPHVKDKFGSPALRFNWKWAVYEQKQVSHMHSTFNEVFRRLGGNIDNSPPVMPTGGGASHMVGGVRMGPAADKSVVDQYGQCWEVPNLFVVDGSTFVSSPDKNPTLTILALSSRTSSRIAELGRKFEI